MQKRIYITLVSKDFLLKNKNYNDYKFLMNYLKRKESLDKYYTSQSSTKDSVYDRDSGISVSDVRNVFNISGSQYI